MEDNNTEMNLIALNSPAPDGLHAPEKDGFGQIFRNLAGLFLLLIGVCFSALISLFMPLFVFVQDWLIALQSFLS